MSLQILINNNADPKSDYLTWTPVPCRIISTENIAREVLLSNKQPNKGGQVVFFDQITSQPSDTLRLSLPPNGSLDFFVAGKFNSQTGIGYPSIDDKDAVILIAEANDNSQLGEKALMVRVRKNANDLTPSERDRFLDAIVKLNQARKYVELQNMHIAANNIEIHGRSCFLVWHRCFLLDLERQLQEITPSVTIPFYAFDRPAPKIFSPDFMGLADATGMVSFSNTNPLINWKLQLFGAGDGTRVRRILQSVPGTGSQRWNPNRQRAVLVQNNEAQCLAFGTNFSLLSSLEGDPHGSAHISFTGQINNIGTAPADPLFFLIHCNVDRLWAKWQWIYDRFDETRTDTYPRQGNGNARQAGEFGIGNFTRDTMWPWNKVSGQPRPPHAPGNGLPPSPLTAFPGKQPTIAHMIDYQGQHSPANNLHFCYEDVPYNFT